MNCDVVGFITLDEILRFFFGSMVGIAFEVHIGNDFLCDRAANSAGFRVPFDVIATFEGLGHLSVSTERRCIPPSNGQEKSTVNHAFYIMRNIAL